MYYFEQFGDIYDNFCHRSVMLYFDSIFFMDSLTKSNNLP